TDVSGMAFCTTDDDCTISTSSNVAILTGSCSKQKRCACSGSSWTGPRCTSALSSSSGNSYGPPWYVTVATFGTALFVTLVVLWVMRKSKRVDLIAAAAKKQQEKAVALAATDEREASISDAKIATLESSASAA
ncbi:hypothetical protein Gpo141_00014852, partial [Globisporangium polare]